MLSNTNFVALFSLASYAAANTNFGLEVKVSDTNWGSSSEIQAKASLSIKSQCSSPGDFLYNFGGSPVCSCPETRIPPSGGLTCPLDWFMHHTEKCCIPPAETSPCDCGEGYGWIAGDSKCSPNKSPKCHQSQWWHERSGSCCDNNWQPHAGTCPEGTSCPDGWFWHKDEKCCRPKTPRSPQPNCGDWNSKDMCCGGGGGGSSPAPSQGVGKGGGYGHGKMKRDFVGRQQSAMFPQSQLDHIYCPEGRHACSIVSPHSPEWSFECIDPATELQSCGGCASTGEGMDCTTIPHALSVGCERGLCAVYTCKMGFTPKGTACVAN